MSENLIKSNREFSDNVNYVYMKDSDSKLKISLDMNE